MNVWQLGQKLYNCDRWINYRCVLVFGICCRLHSREVKILEDFLHQNPLRQKFLATHPEVFAQLTRQFFYRGSTVQKRLACIIETIEFLEKRLNHSSVEKMYLHEGDPFELLRIPFADKELTLDFFFRRGEIREGSMSLFLRLEGKPIYHINFWVTSVNRQPAIYIGCHQGSKDGLEINKAMTKAFFGCRPKNLILNLLRIVAQELGVQELYAVSDYGFYANNHLRQDRKLRISYDEFWLECGGEPAEDPRFFWLPLVEHRKSIEEVPTRKRAVYRRRFAWLDAIEQQLQTALQPHLQPLPEDAEPSAE